MTFGRAVLRVGREAANVAEEGRHDAPLAAEAQIVVDAREDVVDHGLEHEAGEQVTHPLALERAHGDRHGERADHPEEERGQRREHGDDQAGIEGELRPDEEQRGRDEAEQRAAQRAQACRAHRAGEAEAHDEQPVQPAWRPAQREVVEHGLDRGGLHLGAGHEVVARGRGREDVLQYRRGRADDHDLVAEHRGGNPALPDVAQGHGADRSRRPGEVIHALPSSPKRSRATGRPRASCAATTGRPRNPRSS